ncbi:NACHT domain-containing protein [Leptothoe sp. EHU-05/26/07-4]
MTGFEPLMGAATAGLASLISSLVQEKGGDVLRKLDLDITRNISYRKALDDYVERYIRRYATLKVACIRMNSPIKLDEIYTNVKLLSRSDRTYYANAKSLERKYRNSGKRNLNTSRNPKKVGIQVANENKYLMVLGGPGVGKSTFLRKVSLEALKSLGRYTSSTQLSIKRTSDENLKYEYPLIPVMIELRLLDQKGFDLEIQISNELQCCGFSHSEELTKLFLQNGKLLILLDGLDEVPNTHLSDVIKEIENLINRYPKNRLITSCRIAAYNFGGFKDFIDVTMAEFDDDQIKCFIENWFSRDEDTKVKTAKQCWKLLQRKNYQASKELAQTPLLLTLLCVVYDEYQDFPKRRHALYGEALDVLLRKWAAEKRLQHNPIYRELSIELELELLSEIAYTSFVDNRLFFPKDILLEQIREFLVDSLGAPKYLDAEEVLQAIEIQQGILVERARDIYSFSHLTFQEYLTAKFITDNGKTETLVKYHATDKRWREVILLVVGLLPGKNGAEGLYLSLEKAILSKYDSTRMNEVWGFFQSIQYLEDAIQDIEKQSNVNYRSNVKNQNQAYAKMKPLGLGNKLDILLKLSSNECDIGLERGVEHRFHEATEAIEKLRIFYQERIYFYGYHRQLEEIRKCTTAIEEMIINLPTPTQTIFLIIFDYFDNFISDCESGRILVWFDDQRADLVWRNLVQLTITFWSDIFHTIEKLYSRDREADRLHEYLTREYLSVVELILRSREASPRISTYAWEKFLSRLPCELIAFLSEAPQDEV